MLTEDQIDDVMFDARGGELEDIEKFFSAQEKPLEALKEVKDQYTESTPLHYAAANGHIDVVKYLLGLVGENAEAQAALISAQNDSGNTALHWAALNGNLDIVKLLCEAKADPFVKNQSGQDVLYAAENFDKEEVIDYLLENYDYAPKDDDENIKIRYEDETEETEETGEAKEEPVEDKETEEVTETLKTTSV
ncbi:Ankyrin repeat-containing protein [Yarrowia sp. C11]|nr:Ankyrin repeat-containing protein [Yarrowia sp. E02]KAG5372477.1 Ankyrin repeat-containing protein [Yarrowia sp. C11]